MVKRSLVAGLVAGTLDILYAFIVHGLRGFPPDMILKSVASGLLGRSAYGGGLEIAALGLALHMGMAFVMAFAFMLAATRRTVLRQRPLIAGTGYGLILFAVMNFAVVPLSNAFPGQMPQGWLLVGAMFAHVCLVGWPIAWFARDKASPL